MRHRAAWIMTMASVALMVTGCPWVGMRPVTSTPTPSPTPAGSPSPSPTPTPSPTPSPSPPTASLSLGLAEMPTDTWTVSAPMVRGRGGLSAGALGGKLFAIGGDSEASLELYDPATDSWQLLGLPPLRTESGIDAGARARRFGSAVAFQDRIVYLGGTDSRIRDLVDVYAPGPLLWTDGQSHLAGLGFGRTSTAAAVHNQDIYVTGGLEPSSATSSQLLPSRFVASLYPGDAQAHVKEPLPEARAGHGAAVLGDHLYVVGGFRTAPSAPVTAQGDLLRYEVHAWSDTTPDGHPLANMTVPRHSFGVAEFAGKLYVAGGIDSAGKVLDSLEVYDPEANSWTLLAAMPEARAHLGLAVLGGRLFALGGFDAAGRPMRSVAVYRPSEGP